MPSNPRLPHPQHSDEYKRLILELIGVIPCDEYPKKLSMRQLCKLPNAPSRDTIRIWKLKYNAGKLFSKHVETRGRHSLLMAPEKDVLVGWVLTQSEKGHVVTAQKIAEWAAQHFGVAISIKRASNYMTEYGIRSHPAHQSSALFGRVLFLSLRKFLRNARRSLKAYRRRPGKVVFIDETKFNNRHLWIRTYGPAAQCVF